MATAEVLNIGRKLYEEVYELLDNPGRVLLQSKDQITAGNAARKYHMEGKAAISNKMTSCIFQLLQDASIKLIATGSFLKRNPGVKEWYKFYPPKVEVFFKDNAKNDTQWSEEQLIAAKFCFAGLVIGQTEVDIMSHAIQPIFEILEKSWFPQNCMLIDAKIEFAGGVTTKEIVFTNVIDDDSWRLWPSGDRSQQKDSLTVTSRKLTLEGLQMVKRNSEWVADRVGLLLKSDSQCRVVVPMGSTSDLGHCEKIKKSRGKSGILCELLVTLQMMKGMACLLNGLGPGMSGNIAYSVISCPPITPDWSAQDVCGLGCSTILSPEGSAQFAAQIFGLNNHFVILNMWVSLKECNLFKKVVYRRKGTRS
uniref:SAICAR synthetase/ADE2 N-terminal domain-containing protein n=1 Tax=Cricetulus griseus TaxID=10029 RepID=A0A8C2MMP6_CRIGR